MMMHNPPHPGEILREYLSSVTVSEAAEKLKVNRVTLSRVLSGVSGISPDMAYRLAAGFGTSPEFWMNLQKQFDLWEASKIKRPKIERIHDVALATRRLAEAVDKVSAAVVMSKSAMAMPKSRARREKEAA